MDQDAPKVEPGAQPSPRYLGQRHLLVEFGDEVHLLDRMSPNEEPLAVFPRSARGWATAVQALRRVDGQIFDTQSGRSITRYVANPPGARRRRALVVGLIAVLVAISLPIVKASIDSRSRPSPPRFIQAELIRQVQEATVLVLAYRETVTLDAVLQEWNVGSGWIYDAGRGLIVTNAHVVRDGTDFQAGPSGELEQATLEAIADCGPLDIALLRTRPISGRRALDMAPDGTTHTGDRALAAGYPPSRVRYPTTLPSIPLSWSAGEILTPPENAIDGFVYHSAELAEGNSGGPLVSTSGQLLGMNTAVTRVSNAGVAIPVEVLRQTISRLLRHENVCV